MTGLELRLRESLSSERIEDISIEQLTQSVSQLIAQTYIMVGYQTYNERDIGIFGGQVIVRPPGIIRLPHLPRGIALLRVGGERHVQRLHGRKPTHLRSLAEEL